MSQLRLQEIVGELRAGGRLNADDWALVCEMNALLLARPDRENHPDIEVLEAKRTRDRERMRERRAMSRDCRATPHTPKVNNNIKIKNPPNPPDASFEVFYQAYPKRRARGKAEQAYMKALSLGATPEELLAGARKYAAEVRGKEEQFVAFPATWLNQQRWLDEPMKASQSNIVGFRKELAPEPEGPKVSEEERQANLAKLATLKFKAKGV
jgi:hypothetical protein